ncbi:MAG: HAMP domain-containing histidine kinase [candidate division Zixibacteria bacterium]|nr:HAMP domain-containing histidine kinase [candidate division Zixibacteria bacterium]
MVAKRKAAVAAIVFTALVLLSVNIGWWWYYQSMTSYLERQLSDRLTSIAATAGLYLDAENIDNLFIDNLDTYVQTINYLDSLVAIDSLSEVSILDLDLNYLVSTREDFTESGYLLAQVNFDSLQQAIFGRTAASALYNIDGTYLKSAYSPLYDYDERVAAVLVIEAGAGYFDLLSTLRNNLYVLAGGSAGAVGLLLLFFIFYNRRMAQAEEQLFRAGSQAALGRMVAVVSHEVKNPLMILRAAGERLEKKYDDPEASFITEEVSRLDSIVSGYLSFASGDIAVNCREVDIAELAHRIIERLRPEAKQKEVKIDSEVPETPVLISVDKVGIRQVILNLMLNAIQAAEDNDARDKQVVFNIQPGHEYLRIIVSDSGSGIKPSMREKLFEPFVTSKTQGSGLGLYLCDKIVEKHKGSIIIRENETGMTTFEVKLPMGEKK